MFAKASSFGGVAVLAAAVLMAAAPGQAAPPRGFMPPAPRGGAHWVLAGTDNVETRLQDNDYCVQNSFPWIYTAAVGSYAATMNVIPGETACLACIFPQSPEGLVETCDTAGILNSAVNFAASVAATEALKFLTNSVSKLRRTLLSYDLWSNSAPK